MNLAKSSFRRRFSIAAVAVLVSLLNCTTSFASTEASLVLPDLKSGSFFGMTGHMLLMLGLIISVAGLVFGFVIYGRMKNLPVHRSMLEVSELIYETCKTYLFTQAKFIQQRVEISA